MRLIVYNIEYCEGMTGHWWEYLEFWRIFFLPKKIDEKIVSSLRRYKPDILALVEVDTGSFRSGKDEVVFFEKGLDMKSYVEKVKYPVQGWIKLFHCVPILNKQGNALICKEELSEVKYHVLHEGTKRVVIESSIPEGVVLLLAHLALGEKTRQKQIKELIGIVNKIKKPVILMGDFNTFNGEEEIIELTSKTHLSHKFKMGHHSLTLTQPAYHPKRRLDYVLTSREIEVENYEVLKMSYSDHLPVLVDFEIKNKKDQHHQK